MQPNIHRHGSVLFRFKDVNTTFSGQGALNTYKLTLPTSLFIDSNIGAAFRG